MFVKKKSICELEKCYSIAPFQQNGEPRFLVAAEKHAPCYLFSENGEKLETVWTEPGGVMTMQQVPGREDQFLATHKFYSPNDSAEARIVIATRRGENGWQIRTLVEAPFVHRFGILKPICLSAASRAAMIIRMTGQSRAKPLPLCFRTISTALTRRTSCP